MDSRQRPHFFDLFCVLTSKHTFTKLGTNAFLLASGSFLELNFYDRPQIRYVQGLSHVAQLPGDKLFGDGSFSQADSMGAVLPTHRLPQLESFSTQLMKKDERE